MSANRRWTQKTLAVALVAGLFVLGAMAGAVVPARASPAATVPTYSVTFKETGLPGADSWTVVLNGSSVSGTSSSVTFQEPNGTYPYLVFGPGGYRVSGIASSGSISVAGGPVTDAFAFAKGTTYTITFTETGVPRPLAWCATLGGWDRCTSTTSVRYVDLTPGTYAYLVPPKNGYVITAKQGTVAIPLSGNLTLSTKALTVALKYVYPYSVAFTESGLPAGTNWSVKIGTNTLYSTGTTITFQLANGTYTFHVGVVAGYKPSPVSGSASVKGANLNVGIAFRQVTYTVTVAESGLVGGTNWSVVLGGVEHTASGTKNTFAEPNGTYGFAIVPVPGYTVSPGSGTVIVAGHAALVSIVFTRVTYAVNVTESGLPAGTNWSVTLGTSLAYSTGSTIGFKEPNGTYGYSVTPVPGYTAAPGAGSITVNGTSVDVPIAFTPIPPEQFSVIFVESGLPPGTNWSVTFNGTPENTTGVGLGYTVENGSYTYSVAPIGGYIASPSAGSIVVAGSNIEMNVTFVQVTYLVTIAESGLPFYDTWYANVTGEPPLEATGALTVLTAELPNGSYNLSVATNDSEYAPVYATNFTVNASATQVNVSFALVTYTVTFQEAGLPATETWFVNITGLTSLSASGGSLIVINLTNGSYAFSVAANDPIYAPSYSSSGFTVDGAPVGVPTVTFALVTYAVAFSELGLPVSDLWYVNVTGQSPLSASGSASTLTAYLPNGTYSVVVATNDALYAPTYVTGFTVNGGGLSESVSFQLVTYAVAFTESGLPTGTTWYVNITGEPTLSAPAGTGISLNLENGSYAYAAASANRAYSAAAGSFVIYGAGLAAVVAFEELYVTPYASPASVDVGGTTVVSAGATGGTGTLAFLWSGLPIGCAAPGNTGSFDCTPGGGAPTFSPYDVQVEVTDSDGASVAASFALTVYTDPTEMAPVPSSASVDVGQTVAFGSTVAGGAPGAGSYAWSIGGLTGCGDTTLATLTCVPTSPGSYPVSYNWTDANGVIATGSAVVELPVYADPSVATPTASVPSADVGQSVTFVAFVSGGSGGLGYVWNGLPAGCSGSGSTVICAPGAAVSDASITVTVTDSNGMSASSGALVFTVYSAPTVAAPSATANPVHPGQPTTISTTGAAGGLGPYSYFWSGVPAGCNATTGASIGCSPSVVGNYSITVEAIDANGATAVSAALTLRVTPVATYLISFVESGLPSGTSWWVNLSGQNQSSTGTTIVFVEPNGSYPCTAGTIPGYQGFGHATMVVNGAPDVLAFAFVLVTYPVAFHETGLPTGKVWSVTVNGTLERSLTSYLSFGALTPGTYSYLIQGPSGFRVSGFAPQGVFTVAGNFSQSIVFVRAPTYSLSFHELGLQSHSRWCVTLGATVCASVPTIVFKNLTPGSYSYSIGSFTGMTTLVKIGSVWTVESAGSTVVTHGLTIQVRFGYAVTFEETGLPGGTSWTVTSQGITVSSTADQIVLYLTNGTHGFAIHPVTGFARAPASGHVRVSGASVSVSVTFTAKTPKAPGAGSFNLRSLETDLARAFEAVRFW